MSNEPTNLENAVEHMIKGVVSRPDDVKITKRDGRHGPVVDVLVAGRDAGRVIGRQGRTISAMRDLLAAGAVALGQADAGTPTIEVEEHPEG